MNHLTRSFLTVTFSLTLIASVILYICVSAYYSEEKIYDNLSAIKRIDDEILGAKNYPETCPRNFYIEEVEAPFSHAEYAGYFVYKPKHQFLLQCRPLGFIIDHRTGEVWIDDPPRFPAKKI